MNNDNFFTLYFKLEINSSFDIRIESVSTDEFENCTHGIKLYIQKPDGYLYKWEHTYDFHIVFYKNRLPTVIEINKWNIGPTINGQFTNLARHFDKKDGKTPYYVYFNIGKFRGFGPLATAKSVR